ncbi:dihydrolipoyl dehydrogenase family protein [Sabulicella rubraurantiaca]|uniref:dihydrolipoyl dehydrogenase family protein n=1 Tax=Sabulicella rubraurantiaca TaxID=2811429 RepID=UPI001A966AA1|nr:FAD-dependent oxidoreductase [Sabulicella rubraurantiaca]
MQEADLCVVGAGSGGLSVAAGAARMGARVVLVERGAMGGECLNTGCVPSKALLSAAREGVAFSEAMARVRRAIAAIAPHDSEERFRGLGCEVIRASARFVSPREMEAGGRRIRARRFVLATGSRAVVPDIPGLAAPLTNETLFNLEALPGHLAILGGGPIGVEMAQGFRRLGAQVTLIERGPRLLLRDEPDTSALIQRGLEREGISIRLGEAPERAEGTRLHLPSGPVEATHVLAAVGRVPVVDGLDLEAGGVAHDAKGITVDDGLRSVSNRRVFALGDVAGRGQWTHLAGWQAGIVLRRALFLLPARARPPALPSVTYCEPEAAQVGLTEDQAPGCTVQVAELARTDRGVTDGVTEGRVKLVLGRGGKMLGCSIVGPHAGEMIGLPTLAIARGLGARDLAGMILPYPTLSEALKRAAGQHFEPALFGPRTRSLVRLIQRWMP